MGTIVASATEKDWPIPPDEARLAIRGPAEFWMELLGKGDRPSLEICLGDALIIGFPILCVGIASSSPIEAEPAEVLLATFGRATTRDACLGQVLSALPRV
jgi:hypothetical protein